MTGYENLLKKQYEQQLQAGRNAVEGSVRQAEGALNAVCAAEGGRSAAGLCSDETG